jgi:diguanylate cyclase (GGDEF)-like protein
MDYAADLRAPAPRDDWAIIAGDIAGGGLMGPSVLVRLAAALEHRGVGSEFAAADWPAVTFTSGAALLLLRPAATESGSAAFAALTERASRILPVAMALLPPERAEEGPSWLAAGFDDAIVLAEAASDAEVDALAARALARLQARASRHDAALHDPLTGLPSHHTFFSQLGPMVRLASRSHQPLAVAVLDMDGFVTLEQVVGREVVRDALRDVSDHLRETLRRSDTIARLGDDRFGLILHQIGAFEARRLLHKLWKSLRVRKETADRLGPHADRVTFTAGVAVCPDNGGDGRELYTRAELALDVARATGQRRILLYSETAGDSGLDLAGTDLRWHRTGDDSGRDIE